jgi:hypothetical protein
MKKILATLSILSLMFVGCAAYAQTSSGTSAANASTQAAAQGGTVVFAPVSNSGGVQYSASSAIPAGLVAGLQTCSGSSSIGGSGRMISLSFGSTWKDEDCQAGNFGQLLWNQGQRGAAIGVLCSREVIRYAIATTGGIAYQRKDGVTVHRACPMRPEEWKKAGEPLLDPISGTPMTDDELKPPVRVVAAPDTVGPLTDEQQKKLLDKLSADQKSQLAKMARIESIEQTAQQLGAAQSVALK